MVASWNMTRMRISLLPYLRLKSPALPMETTPTISEPRVSSAKSPVRMKKKVAMAGLYRLASWRHSVKLAQDSRQQGVDKHAAGRIAQRNTRARAGTRHREHGRGGAPARAGGAGVAGRTRSRRHADRHCGDVCLRPLGGDRGGGNQGPARQRLPGDQGAAAECQPRRRGEGLRGVAQSAEVR